jgi:protein-disulfide isomerase
MPPKPRAPKPKKAGGTGEGLGSRRNLAIALGGAVVIAVVLIVGSLVLTGGDDGGSDGTATVPVSDLTGIPQEDITLGDQTANVTLIEYADPQCPICKRYSEDAFPGLVDEYVRPGDITMEFRGLAFIGPDSLKALRFIYAAGLQNKLWDFAEATYANQGGENEGWVTDDLMRDIGTSLGLDVDKLFADADSDIVTQKIERAQQQASEAEVPGTPWFYIQIGDEEPYEIQPSSLTPEAFREALDDALEG